MSYQTQITPRPSASAGMSSTSNREPVLMPFQEHEPHQQHPPSHAQHDPHHAQQQQQAHHHHHQQQQHQQQQQRRGVGSASNEFDQAPPTAELLSDPVDFSPYGCDVPGCYASFPASSGLFYHMKSMHPNLEGIEKPYRCAMPNCTKRYKNINGLQYHIRDAKGSSGHPILNAGGDETAPPKNDKTFKCDVIGCKKAYRTANGLRYHQNNVHKMPSAATATTTTAAAVGGPPGMPTVGGEGGKWI
ncbi:hypothetical protein BCR43DRAFT_315044 [Syncephalastrum racemosum]|uniref:C2H2-type domain-containing protein n=1 Tax=Syncephalastrum racemosum TaxID=13706 RepID=A0A1X2HB02_SYNRA|nr:hypothetical protein BCR43DRAFT_315044 [Syncephalastrum racemosum]